MNHIQQLKIIIYVGVLISSESLQGQDLSTCLSYYDFDQLEYYSVDITSKEVFALDEKGRYIGDSLEKSEIEIEFLDIVYGPRLGTLEDTVLLGNLPQLGFERINLTSDQLAELSTMFCVSPVRGFSVLECIPIYRDIFVFRLDQEITGVLKLCFECEQSMFTPTKYDTMFFGQNEEFQELKRILK